MSAQLNIPVLSLEILLDELNLSHKKISDLVENWEDLVIKGVSIVEVDSNPYNKSDYNEEVWLLLEHIRTNYNANKVILMNR